MWIGEEGQWQMEDVRGLYQPKQGMPKGQLPPTMHSLVIQLHSRLPDVKFHG